MQTRDGNRHEGHLTFTNGAVQVSNEVEVVSIPRADIARLTFDPENAGYYFADTNAAALGPNPLLPAGVFLRNGTFIACAVESMADDFFQCSRLLEGRKIPASEVARIICQPLPRAYTARATSGRKGILLANGDFVDGVFASMEATRVTISSVLFGLRTYDTLHQAFAVILRDYESTVPPCEIQLRDQSMIFATDVEFHSGKVVLKDRLLAGLAVPEGEIHSVKMR